MNVTEWLDAAETPEERQWRKNMLFQVMYGSQPSVEVLARSDCQALIDYMNRRSEYFFNGVDMPYYNVDAKTLANSLVSLDGDLWRRKLNEVNEKGLKAACQWVEAENIENVFALMQAWFKKMESGEADSITPDPRWKPRHSDFEMTTELADKIITEIDADFDLEKSRFQGRGAPDYNRLNPTARIAFAQEIYDNLMTLEEIEAEARRRLAEGEEFPKDGQTENLAFYGFPDLD